MCGISGIFSVSGRPVAKAELLSLTSALSHRGPDGLHIFVSPDEQIGLGHTRLAILDPDVRSNQPMVSMNGRFVIAFNGELYNFIELRRDLEELGTRFRTEGDTEVFLEGFSRFGLSFLERMNGMWAALIWDHHEKKLTVVRDRFGVKPVYYYKEGDFVYFSSETVAFNSLSSRPRLDEYEVSIATVDPYFLEGVGRTIYRDVFSLKAGEVAEFRVNDVKISSWWHLNEKRTEVAPTYQERCDQFKSLFLDACRIRMRSDVPVATALSGGLDSTCVLAACLDHHRSASNGQRLARLQQPYSISLIGSGNDEIEYAKSAALHFGLKSKTLEIGAIQAFEGIEADVKHSDYIYVSPDITNRLYKLMRNDGILVSIDGHGADELFIGYQDWIDILTNGDPDRIECSLPYVESRAAYLLRREVRRYLNRALNLVSCRSRTHRRPLPWVYNTQIRQVGRFAGSVADGAVLSEVYQHRLPSILRNFDKASMRHGVEIREPFLDYRLAEFAISLPISDKLGHPLGKRIIRDALGNLLPDVVKNRTRKIGINSPLEAALVHNSAMVLDWMSSARFLHSNIWDGHLIRQHYEECLREGKSVSPFRIWPILNAYLLGA